MIFLYIKDGELSFSHKKPPCKKQFCELEELVNYAKNDIRDQHYYTTLEKFNPHLISNLTEAIEQHSNFNKRKTKRQKWKLKTTEIIKRLSLSHLLTKKMF